MKYQSLERNINDAAPVSFGLLKLDLLTKNGRIQCIFNFSSFLKQNLFFFFFFFFFLFVSIFTSLYIEMLKSSEISMSRS